MLVLITYDVDTISVDGPKRLRKVAKVCVNYGHRVQNSVFECFVNQSQLVILKNQLEGLIDKNKDSIRIYYLGNNWHRHVDHIGKETSLNLEGNLIL
ncbi:MAG: CRISPR-associated endonuclease Cas2 [Bacteroidales bacterium]|nr:CRISPR-associated endonuclease Cas2 [Bacteroidales bacterium]